MRDALVNYRQLSRIEIANNLIVLNQSAHVFAFGYFLNVGYCFARSDNQSQCGIWSNLPAHGASRSKYGYTFSFIDPGPLSRTIFVSLCA